MLSWCFVSMNTLWPSFAPNKILSQHSSQSLDVGLSPNLCAYPWRSYFQNVSWTLLMLIPLHIIVLWVSFYISFARILTLPTLSMSSTDMCKHLKLPIFLKVGLSILSLSMSLPFMWNLLLKKWEQIVGLHQCWFCSRCKWSMFHRCLHLHVWILSHFMENPKVDYNY